MNKRVRSVLLPVIGLIGCVVIAQAIFNSYTNPKGDCIANLNHIALALDRYAAANEGMYPDDLYPLVAEGYISYRQLVCVTQHDLLEGYTAEDFTRTDYDRLMAKSDYVYTGKSLQISKMTGGEIIMYERWNRHYSGNMSGMIMLDHSSAWFFPRYDGLELLKRLGIEYPPKWQKEVDDWLSQ